jgi:hypothetical protein
MLHFYPFSDSTPFVIRAELKYPFVILSGAKHEVRSVVEGHVGDPASYSAVI